MGGSGGRDFSSFTTKTLKELHDNSKKQEEQASYEREVNQYIRSLLRDINNRDTDQINTHLETLKKALEKDINGGVDLNFGGSISKSTYANGLSDIDMLVRIDDASLQNAGPKEVLNQFAEKIQNRLPRTKVEVGNLAVTVKFSSNHEIQLLPAIKTATGYKIARAETNEWSSVIKPHKFAEKLTKVNQDNGGKVVPIIKLMKKVNSNLPKSRQLSGYHIESLAIDAFKNRPQQRTYKGMIQHFLQHTEKAILSPIRDSTGQSVHVDSYLGSGNSLQRRQISQSFKILQRKLGQADSSRSIENWGNLFGE